LVPWGSSREHSVANHQNCRDARVNGWRKHRRGSDKRGKKRAQVFGDHDPSLMTGRGASVVVRQLLKEGSVPSRVREQIGNRQGQVLVCFLSSDKTRVTAALGKLKFVARSSHSHTTAVRQPSERRLFSVALSRSALPSIFVRQNDALLEGHLK